MVLKKIIIKKIQTYTTKDIKEKPQHNGRRYRDIVKTHNPKWATHKWELQIKVAELLPKEQGVWVLHWGLQPKGLVQER